MTLDDIAPAAAASRAALAAGTADAYDFGILGLASGLAGDDDAAERFFARAQAHDPGDPSPFVSLAIWRREQGRLRDSVLASDRAIALAPTYADAWTERAATLAAGGSSAAARESFEKAAALAPDSARAHAGIASVAARDGDRAGAERHAALSLELDPFNAVARNALAALALEAREPERVAALLEPVARLHAASVERSQALTMLGDAAVRLGDTAAAYRYYVAAKTDYAALNARAEAEMIGQRTFVEAIDRGLEAALPDWGLPSEGAPPKGAASRHIFLLGYPRSGNTLLENVLASLPGVHALEERPTFSGTDEEILSGGAEGIVQGMRAFAAWDQDRLDQAAAGYWDWVMSSGVPAGAPAFVDMDPLKGTRLPFIARLFPQARVLVLRRDPRDVVWSCFRTNFAMTSNTLEYTTLERAARHYDALMRLIDRSLTELPITALEVDYQRLVRDFDTVTREICAFTGLEWSETLRRFDRTAQTRGVGTASATQVRRGLYDGSGQWRPFAAYLEPVLPILQPWIDRFGAPD